MNAALTESLVAVAQKLRTAPHGTRGTIVESACRDLSMSRATLLRKVKEVAVTDNRKRRSDAGESALSQEDAKKISALLMESTRKNNKRLMRVQEAVDILRANSEIIGGLLDEATGELQYLSESAITRALRNYGVHPDQLLQPAPVTAMASLHPNHVWQIDASLCVLYYLPKQKPADGTPGLQVMDASEFYKNKPKNVTKIENERVWRYVLTDHYSGTIYVEYVFGGETGENLCSFFINAIQKRGHKDPFNGVPLMAMLDPGSANTGALFKNLCRSLQVRVQINKPKNPRAKGSVEKAQDIVERQFEAGLKLVSITTLDDLNAAAHNWMRWFNTNKVHSRHGKARYSLWNSITEDQLRIAPSMALCRELAVSAPEERQVTPELSVSYRGPHYDVSTVPGVMVGQKLLIARNPWRDDAAQVVLFDADGHEMYHVVDRIEENAAGFRIDAPVIGENYARYADTPAQTAAKEIEQITMDASTREAAEAARKAKRLPFAGRIDPYKYTDDASLPLQLPKMGTALDVKNPVVALPPITHFEAAKLLKALLEDRGQEWQREDFIWLQKNYPAITRDDVDGIADVLCAHRTSRSALKLVGGVA